MHAFPPWFWFVVAGVHFWYVTAPMAVALLLLGWYGATWLGALRWIALGAGAVLTLPFLMSAIMYAVQSFEAARRWRTLDHAETVADVALPARSRIRFADRAHTEFISVELPGVTDILGARFAGQLTRYDRWDDVGPVWSGTLAEDQVVNGIPCRAGYFTSDKFGTILDINGMVHKFGLAAAHEFFGLNFPPGTSVRRGNANRPWSFLLPADRGVFVPILATTAPGGVTLEIADDGRLDNIGSGHGQIIRVVSLPLNSMHFRLQGDQVISELAEPSAIAGETWPAGTGVVIDLATGEVAHHHP
jgi:hypothetical protein